MHKSNWNSLRALQLVGRTLRSQSLARTWSTPVLACPMSGRRSNNHHQQPALPARATLLVRFVSRIGNWKLRISHFSFDKNIATAPADWGAPPDTVPHPYPCTGTRCQAAWPGRAEHERSWKSCASLLLAHIQPIRVANSGVSIQRMFHMVTGEQEIQQPFTTFLHRVESVIGWESAASARLVCACVRLYLCAGN